MSLFEYACRECGHVTAKIQKQHTESEECEECQHKADFTVSVSAKMSTAWMV